MGKIRKKFSIFQNLPTFSSYDTGPKPDCRPAFDCHCVKKEEGNDQPVPLKVIQGGSISSYIPRLAMMLEPMAGKQLETPYLNDEKYDYNNVSSDLCLPITLRKVPESPPNISSPILFHLTNYYLLIEIPKTVHEELRDKKFRFSMEEEMRTLEKKRVGKSVLTAIQFES